MFCPSCGTQNERDSEKCKNCGKLLPKLSPAGDLVMPQTEDMTGGNPATVAAPTESVTPEPAAPGARAGSPGSQYNFIPNQAQPGPGPFFGPYGAPPSGYAPYYNYSLPMDQVGIAPAEIGFWPRLGAYVIDNIILSIVSGIVFVIPFVAFIANFISKYQAEILPVCDSSAYGYSSKACNEVLTRILSQSNELGSFLFLVLGLSLVVTIITVLYYTITTARMGATVGKKVFGMRVVREDGGPISFGQSLLRHSIGYWVSGIVFALGFIWIGFDPHKQGWHDKIARTYVVRANC